MNLMQVFLEAFRALGIAESAMARSPRAVAGIDTTRFSECPHDPLFRMRQP